MWISARQRQANRDATVKYPQTTARMLSAVAGISSRNAEWYGMSQTLGHIHQVIFLGQRFQLTRQIRPMRDCDLGLWPISEDFSRKKK